MSHEQLMREAIVEAKKGDSPYGAIIVKEGEIIIRAYNTTQTDNDVSAHAEINALRSFTKQNGYSLDSLTGYTLYTTCEPCPMCASACIWSGVSTVVYGASIAQLIDLGNQQIDISCETVARRGFQTLEVVSGILADECLKLFEKAD